MLIRNAELWRGPVCDVRIEDGCIAATGQLRPRSDETVVEALGGVLLPGLHDHHIHLAASAAMLNSVFCGPPEVLNTAELAAVLIRQPGSSWLRGIGYHESVAGMLTRDQLDAIVSHRPLRIQHRSGRMWFLNSHAIDTLLTLTEAPAGMCQGTGHLFDEDDWLRTTLAAAPPDLGQLSGRLAAQGVTGVTDMSPSNDAQTVRWLDEQRNSGRLLQGCVIAGRPDLARVAMPEGLALGPFKLHLHESALPDIDETVAEVAKAHECKRPVAVHCTTEVELVFALAVLERAGPLNGDRIEHAGIATDELVAMIAARGLHVVSQPHFIAERGDQYCEALPPGEWPHLYRLDSCAKAHVTLAAGSDAPYGSTDPWAAMRAAVNRTTRAGRQIGKAEALSPEDSLELWLKDPVNLQRVRNIEAEAPADLCLLGGPWEQVRATLVQEDVRMTIAGGNVIFDRDSHCTSGKSRAFPIRQPCESIE